VLKAVNPLVKLGACLAWLMAAMLVFDPVFQAATVAAVLLALVLIDRRSPAAVLALIAPFALFGIGMLTTNLLFHRDSPYALALSGEAFLVSPAVAAGVTLFLRSIACGSISALFALSTDPEALVRALMAYCRLPPRLGYALFAVMQMLPDLGAEVRQMRLARVMKSGGRLRRLPTPREALDLLVPLLSYAVRRASRAAIAMEARGLSPGRRTILRVPPFTWYDGAFILAVAGAMTLCGLLARVLVR